jgi:hypothetical protein
LRRNEAAFGAVGGLEGRVDRKVMVHAGHHDQLGSAGTRLCGDARDQDMIIQLFEPVVFSVEHEHRRVCLADCAQPVLRLRLLVKAVRPPV